MGIADELTRLTDLHEKGALSKEDFEKAKAQILSAPPAFIAAPPPAAERSDVLGVPLLLVPVAGLVVLGLAWNRISGDFMLIQARSVIDGAKDMLYVAAAVVLLGSAVLVGIDAARYGFGKDKKHSKAALRTGPVGWALGQVLLWVIAFPWYIDARRHASPKAMKVTVVAILLALLFAAATVGVSVVIDSRVDQVQERIQEIQGR
jgi:hypothetical protein